MELTGVEAAVLVENHYEDLELWYPYLRLQEEKASVAIVGPEANTVYTSKHGYAATSDRAASEVQPERLHALVIPGGYAPDHMRRSTAMINLVKEASEAGGIVAFICHGGWMAVSAELLRNKRSTSVSVIKDDMTNAGAEWVDAEVVQDGNLISSRTPKDLPAFCRTLLQALSTKQQ